MLVATDVAARGIHVDDITLVIQADAPDEYKAYLHRAGRTGRAGKEGTVVTLVPRNRRRRTEELLSRAEIDAVWTQVAAGRPVHRGAGGALDRWLGLAVRRPPAWPRRPARAPALPTGLERSAP